MRNPIHLWLLANALLAAAPAHGQEVPSARDVVVRRMDRLVDALVAATAPASGRYAQRREVAIIVDVTPYTAAWERALSEALMRLEANAQRVTAWRMAPLGGRWCKPSRSALGLIPRLSWALARETPSENTMLDLQRTLAGFQARGGVVVYLADWHFEDDHRLEQLVASLRRRRQVFSVVGSEAAFTRAWNDGFFPGAGGERATNGDPARYDPRIGRNPFGSREEHAPWHGGETAYPHYPSYFHGVGWQCEFAVEDEIDGAQAMSSSRRRVLEDLKERLSRQGAAAPEGAASYPLPSAFGPYGLMRLAAETGGRYVLWSWNPRGRSDVTYAYDRCNLFPPDLRARRSIRADLVRRPLARALVKAWHVVADREVTIARISPPLEEDARTPREMREVRSQQCACFAFDDYGRLRTFLRQTPVVLAGLDRALAILDRKLERTPAREDEVDRRLLADAHLFRHILAIQRFSLGEVLAVAKRIRRDAWDRPDRAPCIWDEPYLLRGSDPKHVVPRVSWVYDPVRGERLAAERRFLLRRYTGTPFAELISRNEVKCYRFGWGQSFPADRDRSFRNPSESNAQKKDAPVTPPPGGSSGSPGPGTGG
ncbi:MAG: hypothetical protein ACYTDU_05085 [Planctomycetota bacterium]|jgi:hypothetical protein